MTKMLRCYPVLNNAGITSLTLKNTNNSTSYCPYFAKVAVVGFGLLAAGYFSMEEIRHRYNMTP